MSKFKVCQKTMMMVMMSMMMVMMMMMMKKIMEDVFVTSFQKDGKCMRDNEESECYNYLKESESESEEDNEESK